jgi:hypothetical protein
MERETMKECRDCEYKGYSPQICMLHIKHCERRRSRERKPLPKPVKVCAKTLAGAGVGVAVVALGSVAVSLVGGAAVLHAVLLKLSAGAGLTGGGIGLYKGLIAKKGNEQDNPQDRPVNKGNCHE